MAWIQQPLCSTSYISMFEVWGMRNAYLAYEVVGDLCSGDGSPQGSFQSSVIIGQREEPAGKALWRCNFWVRLLGMSRIGQEKMKSKVIQLGVSQKPSTDEKV